MEIEVKLRLANKYSHEKLLNVLSPFHVATYRQQNFFFDGPSMELGSRGALLLFRSHIDEQGDPEECSLCLKSKAVIYDGVKRCQLDFEILDLLLGKACHEDRGKLVECAAGGSSVMRKVKEEFGVDDRGLVSLGSFENVRNVYVWPEKGLKLEVDEVRFEFGHMYEVECESPEPEKAKEVIEGLLKENDIEYSDSVMSKFAVFRAGKLIYHRGVKDGSAADPAEGP